MSTATYSVCRENRQRQISLFLVFGESMTKNHFKLCMKIKFTKTGDGMWRQTVDLGSLLWFPGLDVILHLPLYLKICQCLPPTPLSRAGELPYILTSCAYLFHPQVFQKRREKVYCNPGDCLLYIYFRFWCLFLHRFYIYSQIFLGLPV